MAMKIEQVEARVRTLSNIRGVYARVNTAELTEWALALSAHITRPAQAVDVGALQKVADDLACVARLTDHDLTRGTCQSASERITRALAGEKAEG